MQKFMMKPSIDMIPGIKVTKDTELEYEKGDLKQTVKDLVLHTVSTIKGDGYVSTNDTTIYLEEGDVLLFEDEGRGWIKPVADYMTVKDVIGELECIKDM